MKIKRRQTGTTAEFIEAIESRIAELESADISSSTDVDAILEEPTIDNEQYIDALLSKLEARLPDMDLQFYSDESDLQFETASGIVHILPIDDLSCSMQNVDADAEYIANLILSSD